MVMDEARTPEPEELWNRRAQRNRTPVQVSPEALERIDEARRAGVANVTFEDLEATAISE